MSSLKSYLVRVAPLHKKLLEISALECIGDFLTKGFRLKIDFFRNKNFFKLF